MIILNIYFVVYPDFLSLLNTLWMLFNNKYIHKNKTRTKTKKKKIYSSYVNYTVNKLYTRLMSKLSNL